MDKKHYFILRYVITSCQKHSVLLGLVIISLYLRLSGLNGVFAFTFDQGRDFLTWHALVFEKKLTLIGPPTGPVEGVFHGVWWYWFMAPVFLAAQGDPQVVVTVFNMVCATLPILAYMFGTKLAGKRLGLIFAFITTASYSFVGTSTQLWHPNLLLLWIMGLWIILTLYLQKRLPFALLGVALGLILEFHLGFGTFFIPSFLLALFVCGIRPKIKEVFAMVAGLVFWLIPRIIFDLRHNFLQLQSFLAYLTSADNLNLSFYQRLHERWEIFWRIFSQLAGNNNWLISLITLFGGILVLWQIKKYYSTASQQLVRVVITTCVFFFLFMCLYPGKIWNHYAIGLPVLYLVFIGVFYDIAIAKYKIWGVIVVFTVIISNAQPWRWFNPAPWAGDAAVYRNQLQVVKAVYTHAQNKPFNVQVYTPAQVDYNYHYLFFWYGKKYYGYVPDRENVTSQVFLIIEPNPGRPENRIDWLNERDGDGKQIWQQTFSGNIMVEQRLRP